MSKLQKKGKRQLRYDSEPRLFNVRIDGELWQDLHKIAMRDGITMTALINVVLKIYTAADEIPEVKLPVGGEIYKKEDK